jgi:uncharacterized membrane protein
MVVPSGAGDFSRGKSSKISGIQIPGWVFPLGAAIVVIAAFVWVAPIVDAYLNGDPIPWKVRNNSDRPGWFVVHVLTGTTALLIGALQMYERLRTSYRNLHRWLGRLYVGFVFVSAGTSLALDPRLSVFGTEILRPLAAVLWMAFTVLAVIAIRKRNIDGHRRWMTRSYAFAYMGLTFLILSAIGKNIGMPIEIRYPVVIWLSFLVNVSAAEFVIRRSGNQSPKAPGRSDLDLKTPVRRSTGHAA